MSIIVLGNRKVKLHNLKVLAIQKKPGHARYFEIFSGGIGF